MIPDSIRINYRDRPLFAHPKAISLRAVDAVLAFHQTKLGKTLLQVVPGLNPYFGCAAFGFCLVGAEKNVAVDVADIQIVCNDS
jgi:hypothetical protein